MMDEMASTNIRELANLNLNTSIIEVFQWSVSCDIPGDFKQKANSDVCSCLS